MQTLSSGLRISRGHGNCWRLSISPYYNNAEYRVEALTRIKRARVSAREPPNCGRFHSTCNYRSVVSCAHRYRVFDTCPSGIYYTSPGITVARVVADHSTVVYDISRLRRAEHAVCQTRMPTYARKAGLGALHTANAVCLANCWRTSP